MSDLTKLHDAIKIGDVATAMTLINHNVDANVAHGRETAFTEAMEAKHWDLAVKIMTHPSFNPNASNQLNRTPLFCAAKDGKYEIAAALLAMGADVDACDLRGVTPLGASAWYDSHEVVNLLLDHGADVNKQDDTGESPLFRACSNVSVNVVRLLLENGADVNMKSFENNSCPKFTPLMASIPSKYELEVRGKKMTDMIELLKTILSSGSDINAVQKHGMTALHVAVDRNEAYGACVLAEHGCDLDLRDEKGLTAFHHAIQPKRPMYEIALYLLTFGADVNTRFLDKDSGKEILPLTMVMKTRPDSDLDRKRRRRLLFALIPATNLAGMNVFEVIEAMLEDTPVPHEDFNILQEFDVNQPNILQGHCRLMIRKVLGQFILKKLDYLPVSQHLKKFLALDFDYKSFHPLDACGIHVSIQDNEIGKLKDLLAKGCSVNIPLADKIPLTLAAQTGNVGAIDVLIEHGAEPSRLDRGGNCALHVAAANGKDAVIDVLLGTTCNVNAKNDAGNTPLQEAANKGHFNTVINLINHGAKTSIIGSDGIPSIHLAAGSGHFRAVERMLRNDEDVNRTDIFGNTPLHVASSKGLTYLRNKIRLPALYKDEVLEIMDSVQLTMTSGLPQYTRKDGGVQHLEVVELLLKRGADEYPVNADKMLAVEYATTYFRDALDLFNSHTSLFD